MNKKVLAFSLFLGLFFTIYGGMNYYVYQKITQGFSLTGPVLIVIQVIFWVSGSAYVVSQLVKKKYRLPHLSYWGSLWLGIISIGVTVFLLQDLLAWFFKLGDRLFLPEVLLTMFLIIWALVKAAQGPTLKTVILEHEKIQERPLTIVHLSDLHLGMLTSKRWLEKVVKQVNHWEAHLVVITGDLLDDSFAVVKKFVPLVRQLKAEHGVFAVPGNHEHYQGLEHFLQFCQAAQIKALINEALPVAGKYNLIGLDDRLTRASQVYEGQLAETLAGCDLELYNILLLHQPIGFRQAARLGIDLQLSGHTHRGQIPPMNLLVHLFYGHAYGLYRHGQAHIYTSSGTSTWGPPMRLFSNSELVRIQIKS